MYHFECPINEPVYSYEPGSPKRDSLKHELNRMAAEKLEIPCWIDGKEVRTGVFRKVSMPHDHRHILGEFHLAGATEIRAAAEAALRAKPAWEALEWSDRAAIFLKAAELASGPYRDRLNAATMLGQSKNVIQSELDAACEWIDFLRFNVYFYQEIMKGQPLSAPGVWNQVDYRPLEGFVLAITPFNFTAIAGNLATAPALLGNTVVWKPSDTQMLAAAYLMQILREAGLPGGVINMIGADGPLVSQVLLPMRDLAGINFTGSTETFRNLWRGVGENVSHYRSFPRLVGETGGKDFVFAHPSADPAALVTALVRGAFEYQGQKCSAASRAYIPLSLWSKVKDQLLDEIAKIRMGDVRDFRNFMNAVIDERSFSRISKRLNQVQNSSEARLLIGGKTDASIGYFIEPTVILSQSPTDSTLVEEIFGPILSVFVYSESQIDETLALCDQSTPYALTGAIFSQDRLATEHMARILRHSAGNLYLNDKPTGAVVGHQPFGGGRSSGTNDKAGSAMHLYRWLSPRTIKETFVPPTSFRYPFMAVE